MRVEISSLVLGGYGLGRWEGKVIFVPYGVPGDVLEVEVAEDHRDYAFGRILKIVKPSPHRVSPPCPAFGRCGGCQWLHVDYKVQIEQKEVQTKRELCKVVAEEVFCPIIPSDPHLEYRTRVKFRVFKDQIGFYHEKSHQVVALGRCPLMTPAMNRALLAFYRHIKLMRGVRDLALFARGDDGFLLVSIKSRERLGTIHEIFHALQKGTGAKVGLRVLWRGKVSHLGSRTMKERILGYALRVGHDTFFQNNRFLRDRLAAFVLEQAKPWLDKKVLELYAGVGTFTLPLVKAGARVTAVEGHVPSARLLKENVPQAEVWETSCEKALEQLKDRSFPLIILDPPRSGCSPAVRQAVGDLAPQVIIYVSCSPSTMARDIGQWVSGGYKPIRVQPLDMFPHTGHVEAVGILVR